MTTADFIREHHACHAGAEWALSISDDMAEVWDALVEQEKHEWLLWVVTRPGLFQDSTLRRLACRFVRETPIGGGKTVWDLLTDVRSRKAVEVSEAYADGKATEAELDAAYAASDAAARSADADADAAAYYAARAASYAAISAAYYAAGSADADARASDAVAPTAAAAAAAADAKSAQVQMIAELGNPFKEELGNQ